MKKIWYGIFAVFALLLVMTVTSCTENSRVKTFGGTATFELPAGQKLVNVTWKESELWYLTRPMRTDEFDETYTFCEKSSLGLVEGTYIIKEIPLLSNPSNVASKPNESKEVQPTIRTPTEKL